MESFKKESLKVVIYLKNDNPFTVESLKEYLAVNARYQPAVFLCYKPTSSSECFRIKCLFTGVKGNQVSYVAKEQLWGDQNSFSSKKILNEEGTIDISYLYPSISCAG